MAISKGTAADAQTLRDHLDLTFPVIGDPALAITDAYGVREGSKEHPRPATFVLDADRSVTFAHVGAAPGDRPTVAEILAAL